MCVCVCVCIVFCASFLLCLLRSDFTRFYGTAAAEGENGIVCLVFAVTHVLCGGERYFSVPRAGVNLRCREVCRCVFMELPAE